MGAKKKTSLTRLPRQSHVCSRCLCGKVLLSFVLDVEMLYELTETRTTI